jgi:hypothetical protein
MKSTTVRLRAFALLLAATSCIKGEGFTLPKEASRVPDDQVVSLLIESNSGVATRRRAVLRTEAEWSAFWREVYSTRTPMPDRPVVDFAQNMVIVAAMGTKPSGGYAIDFEAVGRSGADYHVLVHETSPGRNCMTIASLTQPVAAVRVPRADGNVSYVERAETLPC